MLNFYGKSFTSRLLIGTALYPSPAIMQNAIRASAASPTMKPNETVRIRLLCGAYFRASGGDT